MIINGWLLMISATDISYCFIFPSLIELRYFFGDVPRPFAIPGKKVGVWIVGLLATFGGVLATVVPLYPGGGSLTRIRACPQALVGHIVSLS